MEPHDLVVTPEGLLAEVLDPEAIDVQIANHSTIVHYPAGTRLPVIARAAELEQARAAAAVKEG